ncbi:DUF881 domain-containing protein [Bifidobacterium sp. CP2]|uniref:DUF881 domain-containing protein n=1 Tax=Bifidobacterium sp. CP2 TaxID=2809025 RepID=UPI001BDC25F4|nr:DUF881 domain-containing protein [Bifidobacterium sp. CP2]MBT1182414.1 DUF881 domain-containing protein [Bifidobacterium sp. CP2]
MAKHGGGRHSVKRSLVGSVATVLIVALTGYLFVTNLRVNRTATVNSDTAQLVEQRVAEVNELSEQVKKLSSDVSTLTQLASSSNDANGNGTTNNGTNGNTSNDDAGSGATLPQVEGPGVAVTLDDSPMWEQAVDASGSTEDIDKYVIHQQDLESVINALWAGGATSMKFMDQRILFNSAVICSGNVVSLHGKKYSPPFTIYAIGDQDSLIEALDDSPAIKIYQQYVSAFGLGWKVERKRDLTFEETPSLLSPLKYASPLPGSDESSDGASSGSSDASGSSGE